MANPNRQRGLVVAFGFLSAIKGMTQLYEALGKARERVPDLRWRIVGPFYPNHHPRRAALATELRGDWIKFVGSRDDLYDPVLRRWLSEAAVMALPFADGASARRGSLQAAWAFGLPVVTTSPPCPDDAVCPGENYLTVPLEDSDAWADVLGACPNNRGGRSRREFHSGKASIRSRAVLCNLSKGLQMRIPFSDPSRFYIIRTGS